MGQYEVLFTIDNSCFVRPKASGNTSYTADDYIFGIVTLCFLSNNWGFFSGWLYDISDSYNNTYYASGSGITFAGLLVLITTICERGKARDKTYQAECSSPLTEEVNI